MKVVAIVGIFQEYPRQSHLLATKITLKYIRGTMDYGQWYPRGKYFSFTTNIDVDSADEVDD